MMQPGPLPSSSSLVPVLGLPQPATTAAGGEKAKKKKEEQEKKKDANESDKGNRSEAPGRRVKESGPSSSSLAVLAWLDLSRGEQGGGGTKGSVSGFLCLASDSPNRTGGGLPQRQDDAVPFHVCCPACHRDELLSLSLSVPGTCTLSNAFPRQTD
ncbi:hypothetical protein CDD83_2277 [Cordyceps sp. RAO-2017]|nr:hypothetical protein CDD83_2277 [Cordyceps sp. RAO-2017]